MRVLATISKCSVDCAPLNCNFHGLQAAGTLMTDLKDQDDAATTVPVVQQWLTWLATPQVAPPLDGHNGCFAWKERHAPLTQVCCMSVG